MKFNHTSLKLRMTRSLILSITLLASFAGVRAMENEENNNPEDIQQIFNVMMGPLQIIQQYLAEQGMLPDDFIANPNNFSFGYSSLTTTNNEGQTNTTVTVTMGNHITDEQQTIDITAQWPQIQNLLNQQNQNNQE